MTRKERELRRVGATLILLSHSTAACSSDGGEAECSTSAECVTLGELCIDGACVGCETSAACEADGFYLASQITQCREGRCTACEDGQVGCECMEGSCTTGECVDGTCTDCVRGALGCVCRMNGTCDEGSACGDYGLCEACRPGSADCSCLDGGTCESELECLEGRCRPENCTPGALDCLCDASGACAELDLYCDASSICRACSPDVAGCPCDQGRCEGDLFCSMDVTSNARAPRSPSPADAPPAANAPRGWFATPTASLVGPPWPALR